MEPNDVAISLHDAVASSKQQCTTKDSVASLASEAMVNQSDITTRTKLIQNSTKQSLHSHLNKLAELLSPKNNEKAKLYRNSFANNQDSYWALINLMKRSDTLPSMICTCHRIIQNSIIGIPIELCNKIVYEMDILSYIVFNMKKYPSSLNVQRTGCSVLDSLIQTSQHAEFYIISQSFGLHVIIDAMKRFPLHYEIQKNGCNLIWFFTELTTNIQFLLLHDTISVLQNIILNNPSYNNDDSNKSSNSKKEMNSFCNEITFERAESALFILQQCPNQDFDDVDQLICLGSKILHDIISEDNNKDKEDFPDSLSLNTNSTENNNSNEILHPFMNDNINVTQIIKHENDSKRNVTLSLIEKQETCKTFVSENEWKKSNVKFISSNVPVFEEFSVLGNHF